ncbi:SREK1 [Cordylochernes scorpioides]|uniref:SREK1 n=1 Tax=Cordylochernes scorpioides TaxID=51811 RepID=A0ABY6LK52_9ARAC|nr:SREK1 [Cordylochernes scorpioides]
MTNTVFIDRALIVVPVADGEIPDETRARALVAPATNNIADTRIINQVGLAEDGTQVITSYDPFLKELGLPSYPPLPAITEPVRLEEIRRTVYVSNLPAKVTTDQILKFLHDIGEVKYLRMAGEEDGTLAPSCYVEFTEQTSVVPALQADGRLFQETPIRVSHSTQAIAKPQAKSSEAAQKEIEEAMKRAKDAEHYISAAIDPRLILARGPGDQGPEGGGLDQEAAGAGALGAATGGPDLAAAPALAIGPAQIDRPQQGSHSRDTEELRLYSC